MLRARMQDHLVISSCEIGIKPHSIAVQNCCLFHCVSKVKMYCLQVIKRTRLKIELFLKGNISERLLVVVCVKDWLLKLLDDGFLVEAAQVESVEVLSTPEFTLL